MEDIKLRHIIRELIKEAWLPTEFKSELDRKLVSQISKKIDWEPSLAYAFIVALLEDVNDHDMAKKINAIFDRELGEGIKEGTYKTKGHIYKLIPSDEGGKIYVGNDGILGTDGHITWDEIRNLMKRLS